MECWGDNFDFQLSTVTPTVAPSGQFSSIVVNPKHPLLNGKGVSMGAAGATSTCVQNSDDDTICWGSPAPGSPTGNAGFTALHTSYATSLATDSDTCALSPGLMASCTRTCLTTLGGELRCGQWATSNNPPALAQVPAPGGLSYTIYAQVDVGPNHVCALTSKRDLFCFGLNTRGQFGTGAVSTTRTDVPTAAVQRP
jgi:alpha-tubulin suppressor-like RCC1 family protein